MLPTGLCSEDQGHFKAAGWCRGWDNHRIGVSKPWEQGSLTVLEFGKSGRHLRTVHQYRIMLQINCTTNLNLGLSLKTLISEQKVYGKLI